VHHVRFSMLRHPTLIFTSTSHRVPGEGPYLVVSKLDYVSKVTLQCSTPFPFGCGFNVATDVWSAHGRVLPVAGGTHHFACMPS
jgi:hypothetical protein